jgi:hypothetical protein
MNRKITVTLTLAVLIATLAGAQQETRESPAVKEDSPYALEVGSGTGFDSNSYDAPRAGYTDPSSVDVVPEVKPGFYVPVALDTEYALERGRLAFVPALKFRADLYPLAETQDATRYYVKVEPALELLLAGNGAFKNTFFLDPFFVFRRTTYVDHDTGLEVPNQGQLYSYVGFGGETRLRFRTWHPFGWQLSAGAQRRNYTEVIGTASLDRTELFGAVELSLEIFKPTDLSLEYAIEFDNYDNRHARDLNGNLVSTVLLDYLYHGVDLTLRHRFSRKLVTYLDYTLTIRDDPYAGYNDYIKHEAGLRAIFKTDRLNIRVSGSYWDKSYPRSFAFDDPAFSLKHFQTWEASLGIEFDLSRYWGLWGGYGYLNQSSTDPRYDFDRYQVELGARFVF